MTFLKSMEADRKTDMDEIQTNMNEIKNVQR